MTDPVKFKGSAGLKHVVSAPSGEQIKGMTGYEDKLYIITCSAVYILEEGKLFKNSQEILNDLP